MVTQEHTWRWEDDSSTLVSLHALQQQGTRVSDVAQRHPDMHRYSGLVEIAEELRVSLWYLPGKSRLGICLCLSD